MHQVPGVHYGRTRAIVHGGADHIVVVSDAYDVIVGDVRVGQRVDGRGGLRAAAEEAKDQQRKNNAFH